MITPWHLAPMIILWFAVGANLIMAWKNKKHDWFFFILWCCSAVTYTVKLWRMIA